jgi:hypothetical protein
MIQVLKEENTSLSVPRNFFESEKVKKTLLQKIKEIISNFIAMVKKAFVKLAEAIHKKYMETNLYVLDWGNGMVGIFRGSDLSQVNNSTKESFFGDL